MFFQSNNRYPCPLHKEMMLVMVEVTMVIPVVVMVTILLP